MAERPFPGAGAVITQYDAARGHGRESPRCRDGFERLERDRELVVRRSPASAAPALACPTSLLLYSRPEARENDPQGILGPVLGDPQ